MVGMPLCESKVLDYMCSLLLDSLLAVPLAGALGRDALGLGASMAHPRDSEEWQSMNMTQKYEFFAPIWRVMRDDNMSVDEVRQQVEHVALAVKQGSSISDLRLHKYTGKLQSAQVVFFRAMTAGACDYVNDNRYGGCWRSASNNSIKSGQHARYPPIAILHARVYLTNVMTTANNSLHKYDVCPAGL